jgi:hypothetical protein
MVTLTLAPWEVLLIVSLSVIIISCAGAALILTILSREINRQDKAIIAKGRR